jgi:Domain of unknown function (DUF4276)
MYISWALFVEGQSDADYFSVLLPRVIEDIVLATDGPAALIPELPAGVFGIRDRNFGSACHAICDAKESFHLLFVHSDTGGRALEEQIDMRTKALCQLLADRCDIPDESCVCVTPRHETEAWGLADQDAIRSAFGLNANFAFDELTDNPADVEGISDPKLTTKTIAKRLAFGRRNLNRYFPYAAIAQRQDLSTLRRLPSFADFEARLRKALRHLGYPNA